MKTSSYDEPYEEDEIMIGADEYHSHEAPASESYDAVAESYEASDTYSYEDTAQGYETSFARCKVAPIAESNEADVEDYEASFANYDASSYEAQSAENFEMSFAKCSVSSAAESHEVLVVEGNEESVSISYEAPVADRTEPSIIKSNEELPIVVLQQDNYTPNLPPPVPKRTLLPSKTTKETSAVPETQELCAETEEADAQNVAYRDIELVSPEDVTQKTETGERWSDSTSVSLPGQVEDVETVSSDPGNAQCEPVSELYYTASSEVSLLSDTELADKVQNEQNEEDEGKDDRKNVISGHVAAMRERFESMTRTNTPCPDLIRSLSPSLEVFRNMSPSPDRLA